MKSIEAVITPDKVVKEMIPRRCRVVRHSNCQLIAGVSRRAEGQKWKNGSERDTRGKVEVSCFYFYFVHLLFMLSRRSGRESSFHLMMIVAGDI
jgi:hypothetical protein